MNNYFGPGPGAGGAARVWRWLPPLALLVLGFWLIPLAHTCQLACVPGDIGDARFNDVVLEHFYRWVVGTDRSLLSPQFFYPMPGALTFSDNHWGTAWLYSIFRALGWDRYQAFDLWYLAGYVANFMACHALLRKLNFSPVASALGAFAFTFPMPLIAKYGHAQLLCRFLIPVGLLLWERFQGSGKWRWMGGLALAVVGQFYISIYMGYFMLLFLTAWIVVQWRVESVGPHEWFRQWTEWRNPSAKRELIAAGCMIVAALAAFAFLMHPYLHYAKVYGFQRSPAEIATMLPRPQSYLLADGSSIWGALSTRFVADVPMRGEHQMFFGLGMLGLAILGVIRSKARVRWVALGSVVLLMLLTLSVHGHSLYLLVSRLPGVDSIRAVSRIGLVMALPIAVLVALGVDSLRDTSPPLRTLGAALALLMISESVATNTIHFDIAEAKAHTAAMAAKLPSPLPQKAVLFNPNRSDSAFFVSELDGVILAQEVNRPTLNGYSGNSPPGYDARGDDFPCLQAIMRLDAAKAFYGEHLHRPMPAGASGPIVIVGEPPCIKEAWSAMPLSQSAEVSIEIESVLKEPGFYRVKVAVHNGSVHAMNTSAARPSPFHLSWQKVGAQHSVDPTAWVSRVEVGGPGAIVPGETREVSFDVPSDSAEPSDLAVSAVFEGQAWLHDHGLKPAFHELVPVH